MAANHALQHLQFEAPAEPNDARIGAAADFFLYAFRHEHPVDKIGAALTIFARLVEDNTLTIDDAIQCAHAAGVDIADYLVANQARSRKVS